MTSSTDPGLVFHKFFTPALDLGNKMQNPAGVSLKDSGFEATSGYNLSKSMTLQFSRALPPPCCGCTWLVEVGVPYIRCKVDKNHDFFYQKAQIALM